MVCVGGENIFAHEIMIWTKLLLKAVFQPSVLPENGLKVSGSGCGLCHFLGF